MKQRGIGTVDLLVGLAIVGVVGAVAWGLNRYFDSLIERGRAEVRAEWTAANLKAEKDAKARAAAVGKALLVADNAKVAADQKAADADQRWKEAVRDAKRNGRPLAVCGGAPSEPGQSAVASVGTGLRAPGVLDGAAVRAAGPRFTPEFVRQYDAAWTGLSGEPVFGPAEGGEGAAGSGIAWPTAEDVLDAHGENARRCSADRRELDTLMKKLRGAEAAWDKAGGAR